RKKDLVKLQLLTCPIFENICVYGSGLEVGVSGSTEELCANAAVFKAFKKKLDVHATKSEFRIHWL
ncbi:hypothetical protein PRIPAC_79527, partial [Pristionchus pacificus]|uniref:Uncharacterized protein n=1 Tax=Pristionchus pacificus TaxID=54126 RepID=A0A2A6CLI3_PRIPA